MSEFSFFPGYPRSCRRSNPKVIEEGFDERIVRLLIYSTALGRFV
jgi:hypothetical protein